MGRDDRHAREPNRSDSFFGEFVYEQVLPKDHFLVQLRAIVPWERFTDKLIKFYQGRVRLERPPCDPVIVLKMLLLSYLYNVSERQVEEMCNLNLATKYFLGLAVNERPPDHTTLTAFKKQMLENGNLKAFEALLRDVIALALEKGIVFGELQIVNRTHSTADANVKKDEKRKDKGQGARDPVAE